MGRVAGKVALVTGAASGIGRATALALTDEGAFVFVADIDEAGGRETCEIINHRVEASRFAHLDVADEESWREAIGAVEHARGALHILVNNAGICILAPLMDLSTDQWRRQLSVNLDGVFYGTRAALPLMTASGGGSIVNVSSAAGLVGVPGLAAYCASKGGVRLFTKSVALECARARNGVRVNSVHPGGVETAIWAKMSHQGRLPEVGLVAAEMAEKRAWTDAVTPLGAGEPCDIAAGILYLASEDARFVTGSELVIDGGNSAQ